MNNLELVTATSVLLPKIPGVITGLEIQGDAYYIVANKALYKITQKCIKHCVASANPLLNGVHFNSQQEKLFVCDGFYFYYQLDGENFIRIQCPIETLTAVYSPAQDKIAYLDVKGGVSVCDVNVEDSIVTEENTWSLHTAVPPMLNVNWGMSETQFTGFDNTTQVDAIRKAIGSKCTDNTPEIVWRSDGKFFLVAYMQNDTRQFKVFSVTNGLVSENEFIPGLHGPITWRAMHNMITIACFNDGTWRLIIFEASGFAKMVINLEGKARIVQLSWNDNGEVLAVVQEDASEWYITLIVIGNYTFEIKQKLVYKVKIRFIQWRTTLQGIYHLAVITDTSSIHYFYRSTTISSGVYVNGASTVAVIDNRHVALINFETFVVPPPYKPLEFASVIAFSNAVNRVVFNTSSFSVLCIDCQNLCYIYNYAEEQPILMSESCGFLLPGEQIFPLNIHHVGFFNDVIVIYITEEYHEKVIRYDWITRSIVSVGDFRPNLTGVKFIMSEHSIQEFSHFTNGDLCINGYLYGNFESSVRKIDMITYNGVEYLFILSNDGSFICNRRLISKSVVSFVIFSQYILYTTADHKLLGSRLDVFGDTFIIDTAPHLCFDSRMLEKGGSLVVGVPNKLVVILQMPRGNVEMVSTDLLGIDAVSNLLSMDLWERALNETRLRQLNPNIIVDSNIERFIHNVDKFLAVQGVGNLVELILGLKEHNIVRTMNCRFQFSHMVDTPRKIERVYIRLLEEMEFLSLGKYIEAIMITRVKLTGMQSAVNYAQSVYTKQNLDVNKVVEKGLKTLCRYWNPEDVSAASLRTYDLDFIMFAHYSYKHDPQLTSMLIDTFSDSISEYEKRFKINNYIGDYRTATTYYAMHTLEAGPEEDGEFPLDSLISYARAHQELGTVYKFLQSHNMTSANLCQELGEYFESINHRSDAAAMYAEAGDLEAALTSYINIFKWEEAIHVIHLMDLGRNEEDERLEALADHLDASGVYKGAITIYINLQNYPKAIESCIHAHLFTKAIQLANQHQPTMKKYIWERLHEYVTNMHDLILRSTTDVRDLTDRLENIRHDRMVAMRTPIAAHSGENETANEYAESVGTGVSSGRSYASSSSRKTRKEQRRYVDLKEGGPFEDIAIMRAVHNKVTEMCKMRDEIDEIIISLIEYEAKAMAAYLENAYCNMVELFTKCVARIWFPGLTTCIEAFNNKVIAARKNLNFLDEKYHSPPDIYGIHQQ